MKTVLVVVFLAAFALALVSAEPGGWGGYFQYANVPGWGQYEFGYNRGNHDHFTSRFEQAWGWKFKTKVRWGDKKGGYGEMYYDYQHSPKKGWSHGHSGHHGKHHAVGSYSDPIPTVLKPASGSPALALSSNPQPIISIPPPQSRSQQMMYGPPPQQQQRPIGRMLQLVPEPQQQIQRMSARSGRTGGYMPMQQQQPNIPVYYNPYQMRY